MPLKLPLLLAVACWMTLCPASSGGSPFDDDPRGLYEAKSPSRDGIGKVYMGREISFVLGHRGIRWLERAERVEEERPELLVELLELPAVTTIADVGAGSGYLTFRLAAAVPEGKVVAVDIQREMLQAVERRKREQGVANVETVLGTIVDPQLPAGSIDAAILVDAYHEFSHPREMMEGLVEALVPGGRVYLVEYRAEDPDVPMLPLHKMTEEQARREMDAVGLEFVENRRGLPWQHLLVFAKPMERPMTERVLFSFADDQDRGRWTIVNDDVMGGLSRSRFSPTGDGTAVFAGELSLENNGGFASVRSRPGPIATDGTSRLAVRVRGDGRTYQLRIRTDDAMDGVAYRHDFETRADEWLTIEAPYGEFVPTFRGRVLKDVPPIRPEAIRQLGFLIADKEQGPFRLEVDWIEARP